MTADTRINAPDVQRIIAEANEGVSSRERESGPMVDPPQDTVFQLAAGYLQEDGVWTKTFEVRELTGRDEEALAHISDFGRSLSAMIHRGTVRLGKDSVTEDRLDSLVAGDWDTILIALRIVSFGSSLELNPTCSDCGVPYEVTIDLRKDINVRTANPEDLRWQVECPRHIYDMSLFTGATQRRIWEKASEDKVATLNTEALYDSVQAIDGMPVLSIEVIRDLPIADRRLLLKSVQERRVGPDLQGVMIKCPTCGYEQSHALNAASLFQ